MKIHNVEQGSDSWLKLRAGIPTASELHNLITPLWKIRTGDGVESYLFTKVAERLMGMPSESWSTHGGSFHMENGSILEREAIPFFSFTRDIPCERVGFVTTESGDFGASPDALTPTGGVEAKCPAPEMHAKYLYRNEVPKDHLVQVHGSMYATGRDHWWFVSFSRQMPALVVRVERDAAIQAKIHEAITGFNKQLDAAYNSIKAMRDAENAAKSAAYAAQTDEQKRA